MGACLGVSNWFSPVHTSDASTSPQPSTVHPGHGNCDYFFKLLLVGDTGVGKSSLLLRFSDDKYSESFVPTVGLDFKLRGLEIDNTKIKLLLWDASGDYRYKAITSSLEKQPHAIVMVFDVTNLDSFKNIEAMWNSDVQKHCSENVIKVLVGNKSDLKATRVVSTEMGQNLATKLGVVKYIETSAKTDSNVNLLFTETTQQVITHLEA